MKQSRSAHPAAQLLEVAADLDDVTELCLLMDLEAQLATLRGSTGHNRSAPCDGAPQDAAQRVARSTCSRPTSLCDSSAGASGDQSPHITDTMCKRNRFDSAELDVLAAGHELWERYVDFARGPH